MNQHPHFDADVIIQILTKCNLNELHVYIYKKFDFYDNINIIKSLEFSKLEILVLHDADNSDDSDDSDDSKLPKLDTKQKLYDYDFKFKKKKQLLNCIYQILKNNYRLRQINLFNINIENYLYSKNKFLWNTNSHNIIRKEINHLLEINRNPHLYVKKFYEKLMSNPDYIVQWLPIKEIHFKFPIFIQRQINTLFKITVLIKIPKDSSKELYYAYSLPMEIFTYLIQFVINPRLNI